MTIHPVTIRTTKPSGEGTGLGLPVSLGIVEDRGGRIEMYSERGAGSVFEVWLPLARAQDEEGGDGDGRAGNG